MRCCRSAVVSALLSTLALAQVPATPPALPSVAPIEKAFTTFVGQLRLPEGGLSVLTADTELHRSHHGDLVGATELPIASASKWLAVATVLTLVDEGKLDLDLPVARYVREFDRDDKRRITLRQCLANTSGLPARLDDRLRGLDMKGFAEAAADAGLRMQADTGFVYGGVGFQVAAVAAERVTGLSWHELFAQRIAAPLGLEHTRFGTLLPVGGEAGTTPLPWVAGGAVSSLDDYARFVRMLIGKGVFGGVRVLREESVAAMFRDSVREIVEVHLAGFGNRKLRYGLGTWIERLDGDALRVMDPGAFGFTPWIDLDLGVGGVLAVRDRAARVLDYLPPVQDAVRKAVQSPAVAGTSSEHKLRHDGRERRYLLHVPPPAASGEAPPLLVVLHGGGGHAEQVRENTGLAELGVRAGYVVVFPDGTGPTARRLLTWNSGGIPVSAVERDVDDVGFLKALVKDVAARTAVDPQRVFATGHSNGGMMCHRLAREGADTFTGIAVVSGAMNFTAADATNPIPVLLLHGTADQHVLYQGGAPREAIGKAGDRVDASVQAAVDYYLARNTLRTTPVTRRDGKVRIDDYDLPRDGVAAAPLAPVRVITLDGGGHSWPGSTAPGLPRADKPFPFDASRAILAFFSGLAKRPAAAPAAPGGR